MTTNMIDPTTIAEVEVMYGAVTAREYGTGMTHSADQTLEWLRNLRTLDDYAFARAAESAIYDSALAMSFRGNWEHDHCKASAAYTDACRRATEAGENPNCGIHNLYARAHRNVLRSQGHTATEPTCTCGTESE